MCCTHHHHIWIECYMCLNSTEPRQQTWIIRLYFSLTMSDFTFNFPSVQNLSDNHTHSSVQTHSYTPIFSLWCKKSQKSPWIMDNTCVFRHQKERQMEMDSVRERERYRRCVSSVSLICCLKWLYYPVVWEEDWRSRTDALYVCACA